MGWGVNTNGQLADGTTTNRNIPTQIGTDTNWHSVQARNFATTMAVKNDGTVWFWGRNYNGEFGNGTSYDINFYTTPQQTPVACVTTLATPTFETEIVLTVFPNPAKDVVRIEYNIDFANAQLEVYDIAGRSISTNALSSSVGDLQLNTSSYPSGIYIVVVKQNGVLLAQKKLIVK